MDRQPEFVLFDSLDLHGGDDQYVRVLVECVLLGRDDVVGAMVV